MSERRQASRRDPIEVELDDGRVFTARPLPWMSANDLGNTILQQSTRLANEAVRLYVEGEIPQLDLKLNTKVEDWQSILDIAYPGVTHAEWSNPRVPDSWECYQLVEAALDVNHLEHLKQVIDPNSPTPTMPGSLSTSGLTEVMSGQRMESTPDSSSVDSVEIPS